jgi:hypothetical protein
MHSVVHVNLHCRVASSHLHRPRANVERDVHFKKELDFLIYMRRLATGVKPWWAPRGLSSALGIGSIRDH